MPNIGIVILATNAYFILGIRFIKRFMHYYKGDKQITFYFFSDTDPKPYLSDNIDVKYYNEQHNDWTDGTNSKFKDIISLSNCKSDYLYYFDADIIGGFFGGKKDKVIDLCTILREWQLEDKKIPYEPGCNDETYLNAYFHFNPPYTVPSNKFGFSISDKGGIGETRDTSLDIEQHKLAILEGNDKIFDIQNNTIIWK